MVIEAGIFAGIIGHERVTGLLAGEVVSPAQAYLFVGPAGVGKGTVARRFGGALLCPQQGGHDDTCSSCRRAAAGNHPDLLLVEPEGRTALTVEQARRTIAQATLAPVEAARKVFLFEDAGTMNEEAANALLKTLEEPTPSTVFLLVAEAEEDLPATVASRCRTVHFGRVPNTDLVEALVGRGIPRQQAGNAAGVAGGRPGLALTLATRPEVAAFRQAWLEVPQRVSARPGDAFRLAAGILEAAAPLLEGLKERQTAETAAGEGLGDPARRALKDRHDREVRRASQALLMTGLEIVASWYADAASVQFGGPVRNRDVPTTALVSVSPAAAVTNAERAMEAVVALQANQRPQLVLASLFCDLGAST